MSRYEYKVIPAPQKGTKAKGVKTPEGRFATSVEQVLNEMGQQGWEYQRAELLPSEERAGLTGSTTNWRNVLVFRRAVTEDKPEVIPATLVATPSPTETPEGVPLAQPIPGPETVQAPEPISAEVDEPPMTLKPSEKANENAK